MSLTFNEYQEKAITTKIYYESIDKFIETLEIPKQENRDKLKRTLSYFYVAFGLAGETGEIMEKLKKIIRDKNCEFSEEDLGLLKKEFGDVQWYNAAGADEFKWNLGDIAQENINKLQKRKEEGKLGGSGDNR